MSLRGQTLDSTMRFDLLLDRWDAGDALRGVTNYSTDRFDAARIVQAPEDFEVFLAGVTSEPEIPLGLLLDSLARPRNLRALHREAPTEPRAEAPS